MKIRAERRKEAEREMHAREKWLETWSSGGGISEGGKRGVGPKPSIDQRN